MKTNESYSNRGEKKPVIEKYVNKLQGLYKLEEENPTFYDQGKTNKRSIIKKYVDKLCNLYNLNCECESDSDSDSSSDSDEPSPYKGKALGSTPELPALLTPSQTSLIISFDDNEYMPKEGDVIGRFRVNGGNLGEGWYNLTVQSISSSGDTIAVEGSLGNFITVLGKRDATFVVTYMLDRYYVEIEEVEIY